jgi:hypothetical protein
VSGRWTVNLDPDEPCPVTGSWAAFWADPPASIEDPRLAEFRAWTAEALADLGFGEGICEHCRAHAQAVVALVQALEDAAMAVLPSDVIDR